MNFPVAGFCGFGFNFCCVTVSESGDAKRFTASDKTRKENLSFVKNISERLEDAIRRSGKSKGALAQHLGVPQSSVSRWLAGAEPRSDKLFEIANFLTVDVKWLMTGQEPEIAESSSVIKDCEVPHGGKNAPRMPDYTRILTRIAESLEELVELERERQRNDAVERREKP